MIEQEIADLQGKLMEQKDAHTVVKREMLRLREEITKIRGQLSPLIQAEFEASVNVEKTKLQIKIKTDEFWNKKNG